MPVADEEIKLSFRFRKRNGYICPIVYSNRSKTAGGLLEISGREVNKTSDLILELE